MPPSTSTPQPIPKEPEATPLPHGREPKPPKPKSENGHAGLVGFMVFVLLGALLLSPLIPGKTLDNFPGNSQSFSSGDGLACLTPLTDTSSTTSYDTKAGSPVVYRYATTTTQKGTCDGKTQTAVGGRASQFNPLGLLIDVVTVLVVAIVFGKIWGKIFRMRD